MASDKSFVIEIVDSLQDVGEVTYKSMFGEYGIFINGKIVGLICDNQLFVKPTEGGRKYIKEVIEAPPYPGAKHSFLITDRLYDREWLSELMRISYIELPEPRKKKKKTKKR